MRSMNDTDGSSFFIFQCHLGKHGQKEKKGHKFPCVELGRQRSLQWLASSVLTLHLETRNIERPWLNGITGPLNEAMLMVLSRKPPNTLLKKISDPTSGSPYMTTVGCQDSYAKTGLLQAHSIGPIHIEMDEMI
ncbi:hypothetical protein SAY87_002970 [Trapa incisa]|uniref:Uncharacterized protein n=1 Tax=Trapa incisa TaxID=236973 RepID=A0AAN7KIC0_9MYRT|nr:hypothetical protein SAY87_002970 [Trapa incisa]